MKRFEAPTLNEAYQMAANELAIPIEELEYEIIQFPRKGIFGFFAKKAIIQVKVTQTHIAKEESKEATQTKPSQTNVAKEDKSSKIINSFFQPQKESITAPELEKIIKQLIQKSCFNIDTVEVDIANNTAFIFLDGEDAALLIGKEGYRYNALSYILFNWLNSKYGLYLKLEIAQFFSSQQAMVKNFLKPVIAHVNEHGWGKTKPLDGILVQIALEILRETFPNKYVAVKKNENNQKYILINDFYKKQ